MRDSVLVTGGAGYIGSHVCKALSESDYVPVTYDNLTRGHAISVRWGPLEQGDILDRVRLDEVIENYRPSAIVHLAALAYVGESVLDPAKYYRNNVVGSLNLLEAARDQGINKFVFSSSCATYGDPKRFPIAEDSPQHPINPYGESKLMVERMLTNFAGAYGLRFATLRYFNAAGADPDNEIGENHNPETHLIPLVLDAATGRRSSVTIFGTDYNTPDGTCVRDYVHVSDTADAHVGALRWLEKGNGISAFNLGNGGGFSVLEIVRTVEMVTGLSVPTTKGPRRPGDPPSLVSDASRARAILNWKPRYVNLVDIISTAWAWNQHNSQGADSGQT